MRIKSMKPKDQQVILCQRIKNPGNRTLVEAPSDSESLVENRQDYDPKEGTSTSWNSSAPVPVPVVGNREVSDLNVNGNNESNGAGQFIAENVDSRRSCENSDGIGSNNVTGIFMLEIMYD